MNKVVDIAYWRKKTPKETIKLMKDIFKRLEEVTTNYSLRYLKDYIGLTYNCEPHNFISFTPQQKSVVMTFTIERNIDTDDLLKESGLVILTYMQRDNRYKLKINLVEKNMDKKFEIIKILAAKAKSEYYENKKQP